MNQLIEFLTTEVYSTIALQLESDEKRWGDTWKYRPREGQEMRIKATYDNYFDQFVHAGEPVPWAKVIGNAIIAMARESHPEWIEDKDEMD